MTPFILANVLGLIGLCWPLVIGTTPAMTEGQAHATDAPVIIALLVPLLVLVAVEAAQDANGKRSLVSLGAAPRAAPVVRDARLIALLGVLVAINAFLRIPKGPSGEGLMFVLPILAGWYIGARFAFLLGAFSILVSSVLTGGVGPWLPFQMFALGWVGAGAGLLRIATRERFPLVVLGVYAYVSSIAYGFVMTLWFWPFFGQGGPMFFNSGLGVGELAVRYWRFYALTSLPWDTGRALLANIPLVVILAKPVGALFGRVKERFAPEIVYAEAGA